MEDIPVGANGKYKAVISRLQKERITDN
jgi:hypothetical protein